MFLDELETDPQMTSKEIRMTGYFPRGFPLSSSTPCKFHRIHAASWNARTRIRECPDKRAGMLVEIFPTEAHL